MRVPSDFYGKCQMGSRTEKSEAQERDLGGKYKFTDSV